MMMEAIYNGDFLPSETGAGDSPDFWKLIEEIERLRKALKQNLYEEDYQLVEKLMKKLYEQHHLEAQNHFCSGFAAGLLLIQEAKALGEKQSMP